MAAATTSSPNTSPQGFVGGDDQAGPFVARDTSWKNRLAAAGSNGM